MFKGSSNSLLTSDFNNDRKFIFLSQENIVDYRPKPETPTNGQVNGKLRHSYLPPSSKKFPWIKDEEIGDSKTNEDDKIVFGIVKERELPMPEFVNICDFENNYDLKSSLTSPDLIIPNDKDEVRFRKIENYSS